MTWKHLLIAATCGALCAACIVYMDPTEACIAVACLGVCSGAALVGVE